MKSCYSFEEIKNLQDKIEVKYKSHCNSKVSCKYCQYGAGYTSCVLMFTLDYLNKKGKLNL